MNTYLLFVDSHVVRLLPSGGCLSDCSGTAHSTYCMKEKNEDIEYISELYLILVSVVYACAHSSTVFNYNVWVFEEYFHFSAFHKEILFFLLELQYYI